MKIFLTLVALCLSGSALANVPARRRCPAVTTQANFDVSKYMGKWYLNQKYTEVESPRDIATCTYADYSTDEHGIIHIVNYYRKAHTREPATIESYLHVLNPNDASKMKIRYPLFMPPGVYGDYYVLATDYDTYAVVYNCEEHPGNGAKVIWVLTREQHPSEEVTNNAATELEKNNFNRSILVKTDQDNC